MTTKRQPGRPPALNDEAAARIVLAIRGGNSIATAAAYGGITDTTFHRWMVAGERQKRGKYREFRADVLRARNDAKMSAVVTIRQAVQTDWRAAAWWLERRAPDEWGRPVSISASMGNVSPNEPAGSIGEDSGISVEFRVVQTTRPEVADDAGTGDDAGAPAS